MRRSLLPLLCCTLALLAAASLDAAENVERLPQLSASSGLPPTDWLIDGAPYKAGLYRTDHPHELALDNGLVRRHFASRPMGQRLAWTIL